MTKKKRKDVPTQTTPEGAEREALGLPGEGGTEIPIPDRKDVLDALQKVAKPRSTHRDRRPEK
jgi:hypothetical protein